MKQNILGLFLCGALTLGGCGFTPMYGTAMQEEGAVSISSELAQIDIANIPNREGQFLRNALIDRFYRDGRPSNAKYILKLNPVSERISNLDITKSSDTTRSQLELRTTMTLVDAHSGEKLLSRKLRAISSFNELGNEFATRVSEQNTRENALHDLARQVENNIALYLKRQKHEG